MNLLEFMERGGAIFDRMASVLHADIIAERDKEPESPLSAMTDEEISAYVAEERERARRSAITWLRSHGVAVHDDFASAGRVNDNIGQTAGSA